MAGDFRSLVRDESGATLVEYGLVVGLIAGVALVALTSIGNNVVSIFLGLNKAFTKP